jgi:hypothetical protein
MIVNMSLHYEQQVILKRHRKFATVVLTEDVPVSIREVEPSDAPVAHGFVSKGAAFYNDGIEPGLYQVRTFENRFWWPLSGYHSVLTVSRFKEYAARGLFNSFMTSRYLLCRLDPRPRDAFFAAVPVREVGKSNQLERLARTQDMATRLMICDDHVYVDAGEPIWYVFHKARHTTDLAISTGPAAQDLCGPWLPGPDDATRGNCCRDGRAFGLDEIAAETKAIIAAGIDVEVRSEMKLVAVRQRRDAGAVLCARAAGTA